MNIFYPITIVSSLVCVILPCALSAEPRVIYDNGQTQSTRPYMVSVRPPDKAALQQSTRAVSRNLPVKQFPVQTTALTPGKVLSRKINHPYLDTPFFIVGADRYSHQWLIQNRSQLQGLHAIGIAVNVQSKQQLALLQRSAGGIRISPVNGEKIAKQLLLKHYPALISGQLIEQ